MRRIFLVLLAVIALLFAPHADRIERPTARAGDPVVMVAGDIACAPGQQTTATRCRQQTTADLVLAHSPNLVLIPGDIQYENGSLSNFDASYDRSWGRFRSITRPVPGNHEYGTSGAAGYFDYFGSLAGERGKGYYSLDLGAWHIVALNSNIARSASSPQVQWLKADLAKSTKKCTLAYWHHPRFSSGDHGNDGSVGPFWDALFADGADLIISGHDHSYERFAPQTPTGKLDWEDGIRSFVVGTGGKSLYGFGTKQPNSLTRHSQTFGLLKLTLHAAGFDWQFVPEARRTFTESGWNPCH